MALEFIRLARRLGDFFHSEADIQQDCPPSIVTAFEITYCVAPLNYWQISFSHKIDQMHPPTRGLFVYIQWDGALLAIAMSGRFLLLVTHLHGTMVD